MAELEYAYGSEPYAARLVGSNPTEGTLYYVTIYETIKTSGHATTPNPLRRVR